MLSLLMFFDKYQSTLIISSPQRSVSSDAMRLEPVVSRMVRCVLFNRRVVLKGDRHKAPLGATACL
jgi:hypothetical protein